jgi:hypothetical protein
MPCSGCRIMPGDEETLGLVADQVIPNVTVA